MKKIEDHSNEELLALTHDQKEDVVQYECANRGLPLVVPANIEMQEFKEFPKDIHMATINLTVQKADSIELLKVLEDTGILFYEDSFGYYNREPKVADNIVIQYKSTYSDGLRAENSEEKARIDDMKETYDKHVKERNSIVDQRTEVYNDIRDALATAHDDITFNEDLKSYYQECLRLADNNENIARNFLAKRYDAQQIEDVLGPRQVQDCAGVEQNTAKLLGED